MRLTHVNTWIFKKKKGTKILFDQEFSLMRQSTPDSYCPLLSPAMKHAQTVHWQFIKVQHSNMGRVQVARFCFKVSADRVHETVGNLTNCALRGSGMKILGLSSSFKFHFPSLFSCYFYPSFLSAFLHSLLIFIFIPPLLQLPFLHLPLFSSSASIFSPSPLHLQTHSKHET